MITKTNPPNNLPSKACPDEGRDEMSATKRALLTLKKMRAKLDALEYAKKEPIAIVGMSCRFPGGADTPELFWELLREGRDTATEVPKERWDIDAYYDPNIEQPVAGKMYTRYAHFLSQVDQFDAKFFGISPRETVMMDPQQRLMLEVAWEALERAGISPTKLRGQKGGVFVGISSHDYSRLTNTPLTRGDMYTDTGQMIGVAAGRLAYMLGLHGPTLAVDTACSSSLVALHLAVTSLRLGECDLALAGGVDLMLTPHLMVFVSQMRALAPDGRCKTFDAAADGYGRGEGAAVLVLKRLSDAQADGDNILALIRGSAINHDGATSGLTVPNGTAQENVIRQALENGGVAPTEVSYIEAHGTGTSLGDPIEIEALSAVFKQQPLIIGSVKTNVGHLEAVAGLAGVFKIILSLQHQEIPAHLHLNEPNPHIPWHDLPIKVPTEHRRWLPPAGMSANNETWKRLAGVSSFGFSGTNAHVVLEEAPAIEHGFVERGMTSTSLHLLTLSAKSEEALLELVERYQNFMAAHPTLPLADICFTANTGRVHFNHRMAVLVESTHDLRQNLAALLSPRAQPVGIYQEPALNVVKGHAQKRPQIAFLFTGQGSQYVDMGRQLYETHPIFRQTLERCDEILRAAHQWGNRKGLPLLSVLYPEEGMPSLLHETAYTQPALFALEYALAQVWKSWGIEPDVVMGHSVGEYVAACVAGVFSLEDGIKLIAERGRLMQALPHNGEMVAVAAKEAIVKDEMEKQPDALLSIAAINGPESVVISGERQAIGQLVERLKQQGIKVTRLTVSHAFHSPLMEPMLPAFRRVAEQVTYSKPQMRLISNLTGQIASDEIATPEYWCRHIRQPVRFYDSMKTLHQQGDNVFVEIGPKPILLGMGRRCLPDDYGLWLPSLRPQGTTEVVTTTMESTLAQLYVHGVAVEWENFPTKEHNRACRKLLLPTYPFQRERYWVEEHSPFAVHSSSFAVRSSQFAVHSSQFAVDNSASQVINLLQRGEAKQLADLAQQLGDFSEEQMATVKQVMDLLARSVQEEQGRQSVADDWLYEIEWQRKPRTNSIGKAILPPQESGHGFALQEGSWLILADEGGVGEVLAELLEAQGQNILLVYASEAQDDRYIKGLASRAYFERLLSSQPPLKGVVYLWSLDAPQADTLYDEVELEQIQLANCGSLLHLIQALDNQVPRIYLVTRGAVAVGDSPVAVSQAALWGLGKTIAQEHPQLWGGMLDLPPHRARMGGKDEASSLLAEIWDSLPLSTDPCSTSDREDQLAFRDGERYVARLVRFSAAPQAAPALQPDATYLITGGLGALGLTVAQWMVEQGAKYLLLTGRSGAKGKEDKVRQLRDAGAVIQVAQADISKAHDVAKMLEEAQQTMPPIRGIIHAAGVLDDGILLRQSVTRFQKVMQPKVKGAWNLHTLTPGLPLDFFVLFSSDASLLGSSGQGNYAAANAFMDWLAHYRHRLGLPALSINWGPWAEVGMAARMTAQQQTRLAAHGFTLIPPTQGLQRLGKMLGMNGQIGILNIDWSHFPPRLPFTSFVSTSLAELQKDEARSAAITTISDSFLPYLQEAPASEREDMLISHLQAEVARVLGVRDKPSASEGFFDMGMDSLMTIELRNRLQVTLNVSVPPTLAFEYPTIQSLADYLLNDGLLTPAVGATPSQAADIRTTSLVPRDEETVPEQAEHLSDIQQLSASELEALIDGELASLIG